MDVVKTFPPVSASLHRLHLSQAQAYLQSLKILLKLVTAHEQLGDRSTDRFFFTKTVNPTKWVPLEPPRKLTLRSSDT